MSANRRLGRHDGQRGYELSMLQLWETVPATEEYDVNDPKMTEHTWAGLIAKGKSENVHAAPDLTLPLGPVGEDDNAESP